MQWTRELKLQALLSMPWTIISEDGDDPAERVLRVKELPDVVIAGGASTDVERAELTREFWVSLSASIECYLAEDVDPPLPARLAGISLPWRVPAPAVEPTPAGFSITPSGATGDANVQPVTETKMPPGFVERLDLTPVAA